MEVSDQEGKALEHESTAANISSWVALGTRAITLLVAWRGDKVMILVVFRIKQLLEYNINY